MCKWISALKKCIMIISDDMIIGATLVCNLMYMYTSML